MVHRLPYRNRDLVPMEGDIIVISNPRHYQIVGRFTQHERWGELVSQVVSIVKNGNLYEYTEDGDIQSIGPGHFHFYVNNTTWGYLSKEPISIQQQIQTMTQSEIDRMVDAALRNPPTNQVFLQLDPDVRERVRRNRNLTMLSKSSFKDLPKELVDKIANSGGRKMRRRKLTRKRR